MVNKKAVIIVTIVTIILVASVVGYFILSLNVPENTENDVTTENNYANVNNTEQNNNVTNNVEKEDENNVSNTNIVPDEKPSNTSKETKNTTTDNTNVSENKNTNKPLSNENTNLNTNSTSTKLENGEDVAINLAKNKWNKNDKDVYYYVEEQLDHDIYIISVRNKATTASIIQYEVNISTEKVTEY